MSIELSSPRFQVALAQAVDQARLTYPSAADQARITRAVWLILNGHVTLHEGYAEVRSQEGSMTYRTNGTCECPSFSRSEGGRCKHRYAYSLLNATLARQAQIMEPLGFLADWYHAGKVVRGVVYDYCCNRLWFVPDDGSAPRWVHGSATVLGPLSERGQFVSAMRSTPVVDCAAF